MTISIARGKKRGKFRRIGKAKINSKGRFSKRFTVRRTGTYRLRYTYKGSSRGGRRPRHRAGAHPPPRVLRLSVNSPRPAGASPGAGSSTLRHCTMWRSRIRNAVLASPPTPAPQRPGPGRSVRRKVATTNLPLSSACRTFAPHGSVRLKKRTSSRLVSRIGDVPLETTLGIAK